MPYFGDLFLPFIYFFCKPCFIIIFIISFSVCTFSFIILYFTETMELEFAWMP